MMSPMCGIGRGEAHAGRAEASYQGERSLGKGQAPRARCSQVKGQSEPVPEPPNGVARVEHVPLNLNR